MSLATNTYFGVIEETTEGTTPSAQIQLINVTGLPQALSHERQTQTAGFYTQDLRTYPTEVIQENGGIGFETLRVFGNTDLPWEGIACNDEGTLVTITATDIAVASDALTSVANAFGPLDNGDMVYLSGAGIAPNTAGWYGPITSAAAGSVTFPTGQLSNFTAGGSVTVATRRLIDGTTFKSYSAEIAATDATSTTNKFRQETGIRWSQVTLKWAQGAFVTESWTGMGRKPTNTATTIGTGANIAAPINNAMKCSSSGVGKVWLAQTTASGISAVTTVIISDLTLTIQRQNAPYYGINSNGPATIDVGNLQGSQVQATMRFDDAARAAVMSQIQNHNTMSLAWDAFDTQGNRECYMIPAVRPDAGNVSFGGANDIRNIPVTFSIHDPAKDQTSAYKAAGFNYQWARFSVPAA